MSEPCESTLFSSYFNTKGEFFPCSFIEGTEGWETGIDIVSNGATFLKDLWNEDRTKKFRAKTIKCRECKTSCPVYEI